MLPRELQLTIVLAVPKDEVVLVAWAWRNRHKLFAILDSVCSGALLRRI